MNDFSLSFGLIQDVTLILISGLACLYCWLLNKRLKGLSNLESGVGATIVSLTNVIQDTHSAARHTLEEITQHMNTLRHLIEKAEGQAAQLEAFSIELERDVKKADLCRTELISLVEKELPASLLSAKSTARTLLQSVKIAKGVTSNIDTIKRGGAHVIKVQEEKSNIIEVDKINNFSFNNESRIGRKIG